MNEKLARLLGLDPAASEAEIFASVSGLQATAQSQEQTILDLRGKVQRFDDAAAQAAADEMAIAAKMQHGLSREQARAVIRRQRQYDQAQTSAHQTAPVVFES